MVKKTMSNIRSCLIERWYAYEDARRLAEQDPEVDLSGQGPAYSPRAYDEEELLEEDAEEREPSVQAGDANKEGQTITIPPTTSSSEQRSIV